MQVGSVTQPRDEALIGLPFARALEYRLEDLVGETWG